MAATKLVGKWICGAACVSLAAAGCAQSGATHTAGTAWDRVNPARMFASDEDDGAPKVQIAYARWQESRGNLTEARQSYEQVLGNDPKSVDAVLGLARLDQLAGRPSLAEQGYQKALKLKPDDAAVNDAVGQFYASQQRWREAVAHLNTAMRAAPGNEFYRFHLAEAMARSGDVEGAMPHFVRAVGDAEAHYNVGYILHEQGDLAAAEQQFLQAVLKKPDLQEAQAMLNEIRQTQEERQFLAAAPAPAGHQPSPPRAAPPAAPSPRVAGQVAMGPPQGVPFGNQPVGHAQPGLGGGRVATAFAAPQPAARPVPPYAAPAVGQLSAGPQTPPSAVGLPPAHPDAAGMRNTATAQQMEQWQNQQRRY